jgi:hypothetical protein
MSCERGKRMVKKGLSACERKNGITGSRGSSVKGILFVLFALAVCFGYFYFFTDVLRTKEVTPGQPDVYSSEVRKPLPEHLVQSPLTSAEEAVSPPPVASALPESPSSGIATNGSSSSPETVPSGQQIVKPVPLPTANTNTVTDRKDLRPTKVPVPQKTVSATPASSSATSKPSAKQKHLQEKTPPSSVAVKAVSRQKPTAGGETKKTATGQKPAAEKIAKIPAKSPTLKNSEKVEQTVSKKVGEHYTLVVGTYVLKSSMHPDKIKLEKAGLAPSVEPGKIKSEPMNRLLVAEVSSLQAAQEELAKVKKASKDAFYLKENNKYAIYAGSYFAQDRAAQEQERLRKLGFVPILKKTQAPVSTYSLSVGSYPTREAALQGVERLKKLGFKPYLAVLTK